MWCFSPTPSLALACVDVINVSGHRLGSAEIESALVLHPSVAEAAVIGFPHDIKGCERACIRLHGTVSAGLTHLAALPAVCQARHLLLRHFKGWYPRNTSPGVGNEEPGALELITESVAISRMFSLSCPMVFHVTIAFC